MAVQTHFVLHVLRAHGLTWESKLHRKEPKLYVTVRLGSIKKDTPIVKKNLSPEWNEPLTFSSAETTCILNIQVKHRSALRTDPCIGYVDTELGELKKACEGGEAALSLLPPRKKSSEASSGTIFLRLQTVDLASKVGIDVEAVGRTAQSSSVGHAADSTTFQYIDGGSRYAKGSDLYKSIGGILSKLDPIKEAIDDVSRVHPYLNVAWQLTSILYKSVSNQFQIDEKAVTLSRALEDAFDFVDDTHTLPNKTRILEQYIINLLETTSECCQFLQEYFSDNFAGRMLSLNARGKIDTLIQSVGEQKSNLSSGLALHNALVNARMLRKIDDLYLQQRLNICETVTATRYACLKDTRVEIRRSIIDLLRSETGPKIIWLHGVAGSGKSTIATSIEDYFRGTSQLGAFLKFERGKSEPSSVIRELTFNLALFDSSIGSCVTTQVEQDKTVASALLYHQYQKLILQPLNAVAASPSINVQKPVVIVLDALDECGTPHTRVDLMRLLKNEFQKLPRNFRFLVTSRPEPDIVNALSSRPEAVHEIPLDYTSDTTRRDVLSYLHHELREILGAHPQITVPDDWSWDANLAVLGEAAGGLFIWASTAVKLVSMSDNPFRKLKKVISDSDSLPMSGLDELYATVLRASGISWDDEDSKARFSTVLATVLYSKIPLSARDIDGLLGFPCDEPADLILSKLRCLLWYNPGGPVHLFHTSFSDYLQSTKRAGDPWFIDIPTQKSHLAVRCFVVMENSLRFNMGNLETSFVRNDDVPGLDDRIKANTPLHLEYVCTYWAEHLVGLAISSRLLDALSAFAYRRLLFWFEMLSLLKKIRRIAIRALSDVAAWVPLNTTISSFLKDAASLATAFAEPISQSTPHIYVSMLPLTKEESEVSSHYSSWISSATQVEQSGVKPRLMWLKVLEGHSDGVTSVCLSPDGKRMISGSDDKMIRIWDAGSGELVCEPLEGHTDSILSVAISRDGRYVASGSEDGTVRIWDIENRDLISGPCEGHAYGVSSVDFSPDGKYVVSGSMDATIRVWDAESGMPAFEPFDARTNRVSTVAFSPNGKYVASGTNDGTITLWDIESRGAISTSFSGHTEEIECVAFSPDGTRIASCSWDETIRIWNVATGKAVAGPFVGHTGSVWSVAFSPDGNHVVSGSYDKSIIIWHAAKGEIVAGPFTGHTSGVTSVAFSPDGSHIVSGSSDRTVRVWNASDVSDFTKSSDVHTNTIMSIAFSPDDSKIASGSRDGAIRVWDAAGTPSVSRYLEGHVDAVRSVAFSPDGSYIVSGSADGTIRVWELSTGVVVSRSYEGHRAAILSVSVSPDSAYIASGSTDKTIRLWNMKTGVAAAEPFVGHTDTVRSVAFSPDGSRLVSCSLDEKLILWDTRSGNIIHGLQTGHTEDMYCISFSPDGTRFASGSGDKMVRIWNASTGDLTYLPFMGHTDSVTSIAFSPDGSRVASASYDCTVRVWDMMSGDTIFGPLEGHAGYILSVAFSHDGKCIASGSDDTTIRVWEAGGKIPISDACDDTCDEGITNWKMTSNGWICSRQGELLLWIPPDLRPTLLRPRNMAMLSCAFWTKVDFRNASIGSRWRDCFKST